MSELFQPGLLARRVVLRRALGLGAVGVAAVAIARTAQAADAVEIVIDNFAFKPQMLRVKAGTTVNWVNHDDIPHSIVCPSLNIHSHAMDTNDTFSFTFSKSGFYNYMCGLHPHMHGQIVVST